MLAVLVADMLRFSKLRCSCLDSFGMIEVGLAHTRKLERFRCRFCQSHFGCVLVGLAWPQRIYERAARRDGSFRASALSQAMGLLGDVGRQLDVFENGQCESNKYT